MFQLSGIKCGVCGMAFENKAYAKGQHGEEVYWADPKLSPYTDVRVDFCGVMHSFEWHRDMKAKAEAHEDVTQGNGQSAD